MIPKSYRIINTCQNCAHVFIFTEYDEPTELFCTLNAETRPKCCSVLMGIDEEVTGNPDEWHLQTREWREWSEDKEVAANGVCNEWTVKK